MRSIEVDGRQRLCTNSTGAPIHSSDDAIANFWRWFGDSITVDSQGRPLVLYHGASCWEREGRQLGNIEVFDRLASVRIVRRAPSIDTVGIWCSTEPGPNGAAMYAHNGALYPLYVRVLRPYITTFQMMATRARRLGGVAANQMIGQEGVDALRYWLTETGRDGIQIIGSGEGVDSTEFTHQQAWICLEAHQLKSAIGNCGNFSTGSSGIRQ